MVALEKPIILIKVAFPKCLTINAQVTTRVGNALQTSQIAVKSENEIEIEHNVACIATPIKKGNMITRRPTKNEEHRRKDKERIREIINKGMATLI